MRAVLKVSDSKRELGDAPDFAGFDVGDGHRVSRSHFEARSFFRPRQAIKGLIGGRSCERGVGAVGIVPVGEDVEFSVHVMKRKRDEHAPRAFAFERSPEALDDCDRSLLPDGSKTLFTRMSGEPGAENRTRAFVGRVPKLNALVDDDVFGRSIRHDSGAVQHTCNFGRRGSRGEGLDSQNSSRKMVDDSDDVPPKGPIERAQCSKTSGHVSDVTVKEMSRVFGTDPEFFFRRGGRGNFYRWRILRSSFRARGCAPFARRGRLKSTTDGGGRNVEATFGEKGCYLPVAEQGVEFLQVMHDKSDEVGKLVDGFESRDKSRVVNLFDPVRDGAASHRKSACRASDAPAGGVHEQKDFGALLLVVAGELELGSFETCVQNAGGSISDRELVRHLKVVQGLFYSGGNNRVSLGANGSECVEREIERGEQSVSGVLSPSWGQGDLWKVKELHRAAEVRGNSDECALLIAPVPGLAFGG